MSNVKFIIPRHNEEMYKTFAEPSLKRLGVQALQVFDKEEGNNECIFKKMNAGIEAAIESGLQDDDIVVFSHEDVGVLDNLFKEKVELIFSEKPDIALIGVVGATELTEKGAWWANEPFMVDKDGNQKGSLVGHLIQGKGNGKQGEGFHLQKGAIGFFDNIVAIDGCIMITKGMFIKEGLRFDDENYDGNDFYDCDICMTVLGMGYSIAVADILVYHESPGMGVFTDGWKRAKDIFIKKWTDYGYELPFTTDQFKKKVVETEIVEIEI
ncbi:MAG: glycosyltransferase [bacterium]